MPLAAPPEAARSVLDGAEHKAMLVRQGGAIAASMPARLPPRQNRLDHWWGVLPWAGLFCAAWVACHQCGFYWTAENGTPRPLARDRVEAAKSVVMLDLALLKAEIETGVDKEPVQVVGNAIHYGHL